MDLKRGLEKINKGKKLKSEIFYLEKVVSNSNNPDFWDDDLAKVETYHLINTVNGLLEDYTYINNYEKLFSIATENLENSLRDKYLMVSDRIWFGNILGSAIRKEIPGNFSDIQSQ